MQGMLDLVVKRARIGGEILDIAIAAGRIAAIAPAIDAEVPILDAAERLVVPGLVETHIHLDKTCILERCPMVEGTLAEAVRETARAKSDFTEQDVFARGSRTLEKSISHGVMRMRSHVEVDPGIGMRGFEGVAALAKEYAWAVDLELCVFPQEGLLNNPGTEPLLIEGLRRGARAIGAAPYVDTDPRGQIDRIFEIARDFDVDIDMHLDLADGVEGMQVEHVCRKTEEFSYGGRVAIGHVTQMSFLPPEKFLEIAERLASAGVAVTILPATDLYLMGRSHSHAIPRGVVPTQPLLAHGVNCSISTNNVLNPFTPYGDASLIRMANLQANLGHVAREADLAECLAMITERAARLLRLADYGIEVGGRADLVLLDAASPAATIAELALPLWGLRGGRLSFERARPILHPPR
jgi:cytosine deaminase